MLGKITDSHQKLKGIIFNLYYSQFFTLWIIITELREIISSKNHLGLVYQLSKRAKLAETILRETLEETRIKYSSMDLLTATCLNNLGYVLKLQIRNDESKLMYEEALDIRTSILGTKHPETIVSMHNLAELLITSGENEKASKLQHQILEVIDKNDDKINSNTVNGNNSQSSNSIIDNNLSVTKTQQSNRSSTNISLDNNVVKPSTRCKKK